MGFKEDDLFGDISDIEMVRHQEDEIFGEEFVGYPFFQPFPHTAALVSKLLTMNRLKYSSEYTSRLPS